MGRVGKSSPLFLDRFKWSEGDVEGQSIIEVVWDIPEEQETGNYRITHKG